jgi:hypothetical protein
MANLPVNQLRNRFTDRARRLYQASIGEAQRLRAKQVEPEHLLLALLAESSSVATQVLDALHVSRVDLILQIENSTTVDWHDDGAENPSHSFAARKVFESAASEAHELACDYVGTEHLLLALCYDCDGPASALLRSRGVTLEKARAAVRQIISAGDPKSPHSLGRASPASVKSADRAFFLSMYEAAVAYYQPRIEKMSGIALGKIHVYDCDDLKKHMSRAFLHGAQQGILGWLRSLFFGRRLKRFAESLESRFLSKGAECSACYFQSAIYVSFESGTLHEDMIALVTVHELAHALWEKLAEELFGSTKRNVCEKDRKEQETKRRFVEGFATYADHIWFAQLYPASLRAGLARNADGLTAPYAEGFRLVERLVREHGQQVLLEIPKNWRKFAGLA